MVVSPYERGAWDLHWDDPTIQSANSAWTITGVNIYRSFVSDRGPFHRINPFPVSGSFYRDQTDVVPVERELIQWDRDWVNRGDSPAGRWRFRTQNDIYQRLLYSPNGQPVPANAPRDVTVYIDGQEVGVDSVFGRDGDVTLVNCAMYDPRTERTIPFVPPTADSVVEVTYWTVKNFVPSSLAVNLYYRFTTVALDPDDPLALRETPLEFSEPITTASVENMDWVWREAVRRNNWILEQGGERIKVFIRRQAGIFCDCCRDARTLEYTKQPANECEECFGVGFVGGYEGPYDMIIAPDDAEKRVTQEMRGRRIEHAYEVWTGPTPLLTQRDFIVKQTNERYSVGAVRRPSARGMMLQQHFNIGYFDESDIRYRVPIDGVSALVWPETRYGIRPVKAKDQIGHIEPPWPVGPDNPPGYMPQGTEKPNIPDDREQRGRTPVYENTTY